MMLLKWTGVIGLSLDIIGAGFLTYGLIISKQSAIKLGAAYYSGENEEQNLKIPTVQDRLR